MHGLWMLAAAQQGRKRAAEQNKAAIAATWRMDGACQWKHGRGWKWTKHSIAPRLRRVTNMNRFQHAEWATVLELRAMAMALQKNVYVMENTHSTRLPCVCYPAQPWSTNDARAQHFRLHEICDRTELPGIANNADNICIYYNGVNHFEPLMATWHTQCSTKMKLEQTHWCTKVCFSLGWFTVNHSCCL